MPRNKALGPCGKEGHNSIEPHVQRMHSIWILPPEMEGNNNDDDPKIREEHETANQLHLISLLNFMIKVYESLLVDRIKIVIIPCPEQ